MCDGFILLTCGTALNIFLHKLGKAWPPELRGDELMSLKITRVVSNLVVMAPDKDGVIERVL